MGFVWAGQGGGTRGAASLVARAGQSAVSILDTAVAMMGSRFVGTAAKFKAAVVHCVRDMGSVEGDDG